MCYILSFCKVNLQFMIMQFLFFCVCVCVCVCVTMGLAQSMVIGRKLSVGEQNKNKTFYFETESH
jgi:hypothetical protein